MFTDIIEKLRQVLSEVEALDDSTMDDFTRAKIGAAYALIEDCKDAVEGL